MFPSFLPPAVKELTEPTSIALAEEIAIQPIITPLRNQPIPTTYVHQGSGGTPILLIHGFDSSVMEFRRLLPLLAATNEVWAVDLWGFGFTERSPETPVNPDTIKTHLYSFWKTLIAQPVILVGTSMGGAVAIDFCLTYPEAVEKLVLIDSAGLAKGAAISKFMFPPLDYWAAEFLRNPKVRDRIIQASFKNPNLLSADARLCGNLHLELPHWHQAIISFTKSGGYGSFRSQLSAIEQPTLILWGDSDRILGIKDAEQFKMAIANSQLIWIANCGHLPHLEQPETVAQHILHISMIVSL